MDILESLFNKADFHLMIVCSSMLILSILFLQSGLDKVMDYKGNKEWLTGHFANSPLKGMVPLLLGIITLLEIAAGLTAFIAIPAMVVWKNVLVARLAASLSMLSLISLFFGQRIAKDYAGAASLVGYMIFTFLAMIAL